MRLIPTMFCAIALLGSVSALAKSEPSYLPECKAAAIYKFNAQIDADREINNESWTLDESTVNENGISGGFMCNYIWFTAKQTNDKGETIEVQTMTQKPWFSPCF